MASGTASPQVKSGDEYEALIQQRIEQIRRQVRAVDLAAGLLAVSVLALSYLFLAAIADHWIIPGGLPLWGRALLFVGLVVLILGYFYRRVVPLVLHRVNPVFAAYTIEQVRPSLKNGLINFLFLRREREELNRDDLARRVFYGLEQTTAHEISDLAPETTVDRGNVIRWGYLLAAVLLASGLYLVASPKSPLISYSRVLLPWANIAPPTRVTIADVQPGTTTAYQGEAVAISAEIDGLRGGEAATLYYSTADGQIANQAIPLTMPEGAYRHQCELPPGDAGLQQDLTYFIVAGDARTPIFTIDVEPALSILVDSVQYDYPDYTGIPDRTDPDSGDIQALEGTRVTIRAVANQPIRRAVIEMNSDPRQAVPMTSDGTRASVDFVLAMRPNDPLLPQYESYQIRFSDASGRENRRPVRHRIEVFPDLPPEIRWVDPPPERVTLPQNGSLDLKVRAEDPDFGLRSVRLRIERDEALSRSFPIEPWLEKRPPEPAHQGPYEAAYRFEPARLNLQPGDKVVYWAEALDNKEGPQKNAANRSQTDRRFVVIADPQRQPDKLPQPAGQGNPQQMPGGEGEQQKAPAVQSRDQQDRRQQPGEQSQNATPKPEPNEADRKQQPSGGENGEQGKSAQPGEQNSQGEGNQGQPGKSPPGQQNDQQKAGQGAENSEGNGDQENGQNQQEQGGQGGNQNQGGQDNQQSRQSRNATPDAQGGENQGTQQSGPNAAEPREGMQQPDSASNDGNQQGEPQAGEQPGEPRQPLDGESAPGDVFEEVLKHQRQEQQREGQGGEGGQDQQDAQGASQQENQNGEQQGATPGAQARQDEQANQPGQQQGAPESQGQGRQQQGPAGQQPQNPAEGQSENQTSPAGGQQQQPGQSQRNPSGEQHGEGQPQPGEAQQPNEGGQPAQRQQNREPDDSLAPSQQLTNDQPAEDQREEGPQQQKHREGGATQGSPSSNRASEDQSASDEEHSGSPTGQQGEAGAGRRSGEEGGAPSPREANRPRDKSPGQGGQSERRDDISAQSRSLSKSQSDSEGESRGELSGGGEDGGGQNAQQPGRGSAGSNTPSEQGGEPSQQQGEGTTGNQAGDQTTSDHATGRQGAQRGPGSQSRPGTQGDQPGEGSPGPTGQSAGEGGAGQPTGGNSRGGGSNPTGGNPTAGGAPGQEHTDGGSEEGPGSADDPNLEYSRKQTELALEYLEDQLAKEKPDQRLLDRLGWTREDLKEFVDRWQQMKRAAAEEGPRAADAKQNLDDALRSLGLRPRGTQLEGGTVTKDASRKLDSRRYDPPAQWVDQVRAYSRGVNRSGQGRGEVQ